MLMLGQENDLVARLSAKMAHQVEVLASEILVDEQVVHEVSLVQFYQTQLTFLLQCCNWTINCTSSMFHGRFVLIMYK
jgi:hypothetical protein